jgi:hypothetical protein
MFLKYVINLPSGLAVKLRKANEINQLLNKINDADFLFKDLETFTIEDEGSEKKGLKKSVSLDISPILQPEYEIARKNKEVFYQRTFGCKKRNTRLHCGLSDNVPLLAFYLTSKLGGKFYLYLGPFATKKEDLYSYEPNEMKMIRSISRFFFNRFATYKEIYACLLKNREEFSRSSGEAFIKDLTKFFSISKLPRPKDYRLSLKNVKPSILEVKTRKKVGLYLGTFMFHPQKLIRSELALDFENELWLNKENQLIIIASPKYQYQSKVLDKINNTIKDPEFIDFIDKRINAGLNDLILQANFANDIFKIFKTKLLLGNI